MNRRELFKSFAALAVVPAAVIPPWIFVEVRLSPYAQHLARSMLETKKTLTANIIDNLYLSSRPALARYTHRAYAMGFAVTEEMSHG